MENQGTLESVGLYIKGSGLLFHVSVVVFVHLNIFVLTSLNYNGSPGVFTVLRAR